MAEQITNQTEFTTPNHCANPYRDSDEVYRQLYLKLNDYHFSRISFLELLDTWKEILNLPSTTQQSHARKNG
jgi:hypothetical protein